MQGALWIFHDRQRLVEIGGMLVLEINPVEVFYQDEAAVSQRLVVAFGLDPVPSAQPTRERAWIINLNDCSQDTTPRVSGSTRKINRLQPPRYSWLNNQRCSDQRAAAEAVFRDLAPEDRAWVPVGAPGKPEALTAPVASQFIDLLAQTCAGGNGGIQASAIGRSNCIKRRKIQPSW